MHRLQLLLLTLRAVIPVPTALYRDAVGRGLFCGGVLIDALGTPHAFRLSVAELRWDL